MQGLDVKVDAAVGIIRIARPEKRNALTRDMMRGIADTVARLEREGARALVLTGTSEVFTSGADLDEFSFDETDLAIEDGLATAADAVAGVAVPTIAAIEGPCLGAGVELAVSCDVRIAGEGATFMIPATRLGILYRPDGLARIERAVGRQTTARLFLLNETIDGDGAVSAGLAALLTERGGALALAKQLAGHAAGLHADAIGATKRLLDTLHEATPDTEHWNEIRKRLLRRA